MPPVKPGGIFLPRRLYIDRGDVMNQFDKNFYSLADEIGALGEKELYHRIRSAFERVPEATRKSCADFFNRFGFWGRLEPENGVYEQIEQKQIALSEHLDDFVQLYGRLGDWRSKAVLYAVLSNWYRYDFTATAASREYLFDDYFDLDLLQCTRGEVFVDLGAYTGDTVLSYIRSYGAENYRRIYCYEITPESFAVLRQRLGGLRDIELRQKGVSDAPGLMSLDCSALDASANRLAPGGDIEVTTLDEDIAEPVTLIKADIEGFERRALLGAQRHISAERPRLLISVYHNNEDIWKIPRLLDGLVPDYRYYLRFRSSPLYPTELPLFAL